MPKALADSKTADRKAFTNKTGLKQPKHQPLIKSVEDDHDGVQVFQLPPGVLLSEAPIEAMQGVIIMGATVEGGPSDRRGIDSESSVMSNRGFSTFNPSAGEPSMEQAAEVTQTEALTVQQLATQAALDKIAMKAAKAEAAAFAKSQREAEAKIRAEARAAKTAENAEARALRQKELAESGRTYVGSMVSLADRVREGHYVKGLNGQLRTSDELALALDAVPPANVIKLALEALELEANPYVHLNQGQQSMNLRNKMRGAIKAGTLTVDAVKQIRDANGYATAEADAIAKKEAQVKAKAEREAKAQEIAAAKAAAKPAPAASVSMAGATAGLPTETDGDTSTGMSDTDAPAPGVEAGTEGDKPAARSRKAKQADAGASAA